MTFHVSAREGTSEGSDTAGGTGQHLPSAPRVVTMTPAPSIDKVYFLEQIRAGHVNRANRVTTYYAGNGINVARSLHLAGSTVSAVFPTDGGVAALCDEELNRVITAVDTGTPTRTNVILVDEHGTTTNINARPEPLNFDQWTRLCRAAIDEVCRIQADWFVLGGTLPINIANGLPVDFQPLFRDMRSLGVSICLDAPLACTSSNWLEGCEPDLVKPNAEELSALAGIPVTSLQDAVDAAALVRASGVTTVLASLGPAGILDVSAQGILWARGPEAKVVNTTGAGDAALAGYLSIADGDNASISGRHKALQRAVAWGALAVQQPTTKLPHIIKDPTDILVMAPEWDRHLLLT